MARAFVRHAPVILLDEPTSFMDSWAELEWFDRLRNLSQGRTTLLITHHRHARRLDSSDEARTDHRSGNP